MKTIYSTEKSIDFAIPKKQIIELRSFLKRNIFWMIAAILSVLSISYFYVFLQNGLGLSYNDARSHLDIGRRVVENLKPGLAQLGSVWLPLNHILMIPLVWNNWAWHSGFAGAIWNMISFVATGLIIYKILEKLNVNILGRIAGVAVFALNLNILYLQSTAMTELLLLATMTAGCYYLICWAEDKSLLNLMKTSLWIMLSTLVRYDGWFLLLFATAIVAISTWKNRGYKVAEGLTILFLTMGAVGIVLWFGWNAAIFKDPLYFVLGPFSAHAQQMQLLAAGNLPTKGNLLLSGQIYLYAILYNCITFVAGLGFIAGILLWSDKNIKGSTRLATVSLAAPLVFNILALVMGFSVLFVQGISGNTWFNIRYGIMMMPAFAVFIGYLIGRVKNLRWVLIGLYAFIMFFAFRNGDAVTIDDARVGSSQKNVSQVAGYLNQAAGNQPGFILISVASHDAIIFSSGLPMSRFIHEGTGLYWTNALARPDKWARWIVMRTYDNNDLTYKAIANAPGFAKYHLVSSYPFADVYEIDPQYLSGLNYTPVLGKQK